MRIVGQPSHPCRARCRAPGGIAAACLLLSACAPVGSLRPNAWPDPDRSTSVGVGVTRAVPIPGREAYFEGPGSVGIGTALHANVAHRFESGFELSGVAFVGSLSGGGLGASGRWQVLETTRWRVGLEFGAGAFWAQLCLPTAWHLGNGIWMTTAPELAVSWFPPVRLPLGVAWLLAGHVFHVEATAAIDPLNRSFHGHWPISIAIAIGWQVAP